MKDYDYEEDVKNPSRWKMLKVLALMKVLLVGSALLQGRRASDGPYSPWNRSGFCRARR